MPHEQTIAQSHPDSPTHVDGDDYTYAARSFHYAPEPPTWTEQVDARLAVTDARLADAVRQGWLTPALVDDGSVPPRAPNLPFAALLAELRGDRDAR